MFVEIVTTGSELLLGEIINDNSRFLSEELNKLGYFVIYHTTVGDNPQRMEEVLQTAISRADIIITTGGLGPTQGDMTKEIAAKVLHLPMEYHPELEEQIRRWFCHRHRSMSPNNERQAMAAKGAYIFTNEAGTAPGMAIHQNGKLIVHLPGPPREMRWMYEHRLKLYLLENFGSQGCIKSLILKVYDMGESDMEQAVMDLVKGQSNPTLALYAKPGYVELRITARAATEEAAAALLRPMEYQLQQRLHRSVIAYNKETMAEVLGRTLLSARRTVSCAESCTGGLLGSYITDVPGSSAYFLGSAVTYCDTVKHHILGVSTDTLEQFSAVSEQTAGEMARGSRSLYHADIAISTTGIAGPEGGTEEKPVGLVYTGIDGPWGMKVYKDIYVGDRPEVKRRAAIRAMYYAVVYLLENKE
ncbi:competence/damage-inducible protein A [Megasphaera paucivorans]|uniref:Putative competence-damage inducible protein n=1 Tax=Megasphaera paucivorans TaxID=349095 RepID=A0A1G9TGT3_9FIRM|nr:competence/damage-inducible protein A [Megasphaera paucivorans]SDM46704.1 nicotinamide-nucleotide amidase [Megasphaera paucivorans]